MTEGLYLLGYYGRYLPTLGSTTKYLILLIWEWNPLREFDLFRTSTMNVQVSSLYIYTYTYTLGNSLQTYIQKTNYRQQAQEQHSPMIINKT